MWSGHDGPVALSLHACQHLVAKASMGEVKHAKNPIVHYLALRLEKDVSPNCSNEGAHG
jgi:hypothetical protein